MPSLEADENDVDKVSIHYVLNRFEESLRTFVKAKTKLKPKDIR